jgi:DNA-binding PadR family transcriptional regulator
VKNLSVNAQMFLIAIWRLADEAYGVRIRDKIAEMTGRTFTFGTLYNTLDQLTRKGYVKARPVRVLNRPEVRVLGAYRHGCRGGERFSL